MTRAGFYDARNPWPGVPNPGSEEARAEGCSCPAIDNDYGRLVGGMGFYLAVDCTLHGRDAADPDVQA